MTTHTTTIDNGVNAVTHRTGSHEVRLSILGQAASLPIPWSHIDDVVELLVAVKLAVDAAERRKARCEE